MCALSQHSKIWLLQVLAYLTGVAGSEWGKELALLGVGENVDLIRQDYHEHIRHEQSNQVGLDGLHLADIQVFRGSALQEYQGGSLAPGGQRDHQE